MLPDIVQLSGVGLAGLIAYFGYKIVANHLNHNTRVLNNLEQAIKELKDWLQDNAYKR